MNRKNIYPKTKGYWVYSHTTPDGKQYIGMSKLQTYRRWQPSMYKKTALYQYIEQYGWENIEHKVLIDNLTKAQAEQLEDQIITALQMNGLCINSNRSGGYWRDNQKDYDKVYYEAHSEQKKVYRETHKEEKKAYDKQRYTTPEGKIYYMVKSYNRYHTPIETPMMAKLNYIMLGIVPWYIKNYDLFESK